MDAIPSVHPPKMQSIEKTEQKQDILPNEIQMKTKLILENSDLTITLNLSICDQKIKFLVDTGAHASMIRSKRILSNVLYYPQIKYCMIGINGPNSSIKTHGATFGNLTINGIQLKHQFQIAGEDIHMNYDGILGLDFITAYKAIIDVRNLKLTILLPPSHNLYEFEERKTFESTYPSLHKVQIKNLLIYLDDSQTPQIEKTAPTAKSNGGSKKLADMESKINRMEAIHLGGSTNGNKSIIPPHGEQLFTVQTKIPMLCKESTIQCGLYIANTVVSAENNKVSVFNTNDTPISISSLNVEVEPIANYHVYTIKKPIDFSQKLLDFETDTSSKAERIKKILNKLNMSHCDNHEKMLIHHLVNEYHDIFHLEGDGLSFAKKGEHRIFTKPGINPVITKQYRIPHSQKNLVQEKIAEMLRDGIIEPSTSLWNSPILLVPKKSSTDKKEYRFCVDYRNVNKNTETRAFPMPNLEDELCKMNGSKFFSTLDIASAFHQIKMNENDKEKTAFSTGHQKYHFQRMPFGLSGSPITWQSYITALLGDLLNKNVMAYMDDILIYDPTLNEHIDSIIRVFDRLRDSNLKIKIEKTKLFQKSVDYLGHTIDKNGSRPNKRNIEAILQVPTPKNLAETQRFLGMASYFRKFIRRFSEIARPLHDLCKKNMDFIWSKDCANAFETLKKALTSAPVLAFPDFKRKFYISVDASFHSVGGYISNDPPPNDKPIEFFSKTLNAAQKNYATTHKELLAIIMAIERFQHYIWGKHFVIYTDHEALKYLFNQTKVGSRLLRWKLQLAEYNFDIIHRKGSQNVVSDCLSRLEPNGNTKLPNLTENTTLKTILQIITRSRAKESEIIATAGEENGGCVKKTAQISEEPNTTLDARKFVKILFIIDDRTSTPFKKLQMFIKKRINLTNSIPYEIYTLAPNIDFIFIPKINFNCEQLGETIKIFCTSKLGQSAERIAVNFGVSNFRTYWQIKKLFREIFAQTNVSITFFTGSQVEISNINDMNEILRVYHRSILGGHRGVERMLNTIKKFYTWPTMKTDIKKYVQECAICEKSKIHKHTCTPLQITSVATAPFEKIYIDFVGEINPNSEGGHKYIMSISCDLTKYLIMVPTFDATALTAAKIIVEEVCLIFNFPKMIVSDNGPAFTAEIFKQMAKLLDIRHIKTTPYHPQSNGSIERYHRTLGQYIRAYTQKNQSQWSKYLPFFTFSYNTTVHSTTGFAPHTLVFGYDLQIPIKTKTARQNYDYDSYHHELLHQLRDAQERAKELIQSRKLENKKHYDKKKLHSHLALKRNDLVLVRNDVKKNKFQNKYSGPYRVEEVISPAVTKIKRGNKSQIIHNDKLKISNADHGDATPPPLNA